MTRNVALIAPAKPKKVTKRELENWDWNRSLSKCKNLFKLVREKGSEFVYELYIAHEAIVLRKVKGQGWEKFCDEIGISTQTAINWFRRFDLRYTRISGPEPKVLGSPKKVKRKSKRKELEEDLKKAEEMEDAEFWEIAVEDYQIWYDQVYSVLLDNAVKELLPLQQRIIRRLEIHPLPLPKELANEEIRDGVRDLLNAAINQSLPNYRSEVLVSEEYKLRRGNRKRLHAYR